MSSITGIDGLSPTLKSIKFTKTIAIANKESIICGWNLIKKIASKNNTKIIPIRLTINTYSNPEKRETAVAGRIRIPAIPNLSAIEPADHEMDAAKANKIPTRTVLILMH